MGEPEIDEERFRKLERFNIEYDLWIDQEEHRKVAKCIVLRDGRGASIKGRQLRDDVSKHVVVAQLDISGQAQDLRLSGGGLEKAWAGLFVAKRVRGHLQMQPKTPPWALERLAEFLIVGMRQLSVVEPSDEASKEDAAQPYRCEAHRTLSLLYLNEICACYKGELSVGFAEQAMDRIRGWQPQPNDGQNIYELLALLNRGIGYQHRHQHRKALYDFEQIMFAVENWDDRKIANYVESLRDTYVCGKIPYDNEVELRDLWKCYVYAPAVIHKAEVLADLNRSVEQLRLLTKLDGLPPEFGEYWRRTGLLLRALAEKDGSLWDYRQSVVSPEPVIESIRRWPAKEIKGKQELLQKRDLVLVEHQIEMVRQLQAGTTAQAASLRELHDDLVKIDTESQAKGDGEKKDVCRLWIDYYDVLLSLRAGVTLALPEDVERICRLTKSFMDAHWFPDREESGRKLLKALRKASEALVRGKSALNRNGDMERLKDAEVGLLRHFLDDREVTEWRKAKVARRLQEIGESLDDSQAKLREPDVEECRAVRDDARAVFCDARRCVHKAGDEACVAFKGCRANTYQNILRRNEGSFTNQLLKPSHQPGGEGYWLTVLRRWQSYTPALSSGDSCDSRGGGYFIYKTDSQGEITEGIVVDPGFDFVENFLHKRFSIRDIDAVAMTHAHVDHTADFQSLITLVVERTKRRDNEKIAESPRDKLLAVMSPGTFDRYKKAVAVSRDFFRDVIVMSPGDGLWSGHTSVPEDPRQLSAFRIRPCHALHNDLTERDSIGLVLYGKPGGDCWAPLVGFTGDTMWGPDMAGEYRDVPTMCVNMGGIVPSETTIAKGLLVDDNEGIRGIVRGENHLYWPGFSLLTGRLVDSQLIIISELGEELKGGIRTDMTVGLRKLGRASTFLPEDIGLTVKLGGKPEVYCMACGQTVSVQEARFDSFGPEESTYYICRSCKKYRPAAVTQAIAECHQDGWPIETG